MPFYYSIDYCPFVLASKARYKAALSKAYIKISSTMGCVSELLICITSITEQIFFHRNGSEAKFDSIQDFNLFTLFFQPLKSKNFSAPHTSRNFVNFRYGLNSLSFRGTLLWNALDDELKRAETLRSFKRGIKEWDGNTCKCF